MKNEEKQKNIFTDGICSALLVRGIYCREIVCTIHTTFYVDIFKVFVCNDYAVFYQKRGFACISIYGNRWNGFLPCILFFRIEIYHSNKFIHHSGNESNLYGYYRLLICKTENYQKNAAGNSHLVCRGCLDDNSWKTGLDHGLEF